MSDTLIVVTYEKLVSDNIPRIVESEPGGWHESREVSGEELLEVVKDKLVEEIEEVISAPDKNKQMKELSTLILLLSKFKEVMGISDQELTEATERLVASGKTFEKNIFLIKATVPKDKVVNSVKEIYTLSTITATGEKKNYTIAAVTDRAAIRKAKALMENAPEEIIIAFTKVLKI